MEWKVIPSSNGKYEASSDGQIRNVATKKIRKPSKNSKGYLQISGVGSSHLVHRLVAEAFIPNPENKPEIDHIDGNPLNCSVDNLR